MLPPVELLKARIISRLETLTADELEQVLGGLPDKSLMGTPVREFADLSREFDSSSDEWDDINRVIEAAFGQVWEDDDSYQLD